MGMQITGIAHGIAPLSVAYCCQIKFCASFPYHNYQFWESQHIPLRLSCRLLLNWLLMELPRGARKGTRSERRCQSRCVCRQKHEAQEKESMIFQSPKSDDSASEYWARKVEGKFSKKSGFWHLQKSGFGREPQNEPQDNLRVQKSLRKVRKTPDFLSKSGVFMVAEAGLEPTTSGL